MTTRLKIGIVRKAHCNTCNLQTPHELKNSSVRSRDYLQGEGTEMEFVEWWEEYEYRFWVCQVCNTANLEVSYNNPETNSLELDAPSTWYPAPAKHVPMRFQRFGKKPLITIYQEVVETYNGGLRFSCASGLRVLLEGICVNMGIEDKAPTQNLTNKLYALAERDLVQPEIVHNLFALKFIGDEAIHHLKLPTAEELETGIKIVESLISHLYRESEFLLASHARDLAEKHPEEVERARQKKAT